MEFNYNKTALRSIAKNVIYYFLLGLAFNVLVFILIWVLSKWEFTRLYHNPFLRPFNGLWVWVIMGVVVGWFRRKNAKPLTIKRWVRSLLYVFVFGAFIASFQLHYVHRENGGWNGLRGTECVHKYQSYFLIKNRQHFISLDQCLAQLKTQKDNTYQAKSYHYNNVEDYKGQLIDYDIITPKLIWGLIIFIIISLIELLRRYGPVRMYKAGGKYLKFWQDGISNYNKNQFELILLGSSIYLIALYLLPKVNGLPNSKLQIFVLLGILMLAYRIVIRKGRSNLFKSNNFKEWFFVLFGVLIACVLLLISANKIFYILLIFSVVAYIYTSKLLNFKFIKAIAIVVLLLNIENLFAIDDGTWTEGGLENMLNDSHGPESAGQAEELGGEAGVVVDTAQEEEDDDDAYIDELASNFDGFEATREQIIEKTQNLKGNFENLLEQTEDPNIQSKINKALQELDAVKVLVDGNLELTSNTINHVNDLMKYPDELYEELIKEL